MILISPSAILFDFGAVKIYYYGVIMAIAVLMGLLICKIICEKFYDKKDWEITYNLSLGTVISGFLGARVYYVLAAYKYFSQNPNEIFAFYHGGMSIHGAILGGLIFACLYLWRKKLPILKYLDIMTFGLITGQIIGRWGNFFNSEAFGLPTYSFLKLYIPLENRPAEFMVFDYFHPTFLYESLLNIVILIILTILLKRLNCCTDLQSDGNDKAKKSSISYQHHGLIFFTYIILYSIIRIFIEQIRLDSVLNFGNIPLAQIVSIIGIIVGLSGIFILKRKN